MNTPGPGSTTDLEQIEWLLSHFASGSSGVIATVTIASDGRLLTTSDALTRTDAQRLAAFTMAFTSLARGAGAGFDLGEPMKVTVDLDHGSFLIKPINVRCVLGIVANADVNLDELAEDATILAHHVRGAITAEVIGELAAATTGGPNEQ